MNVSARQFQQVTILDVSGNIDMSNSPQVRQALLREIRKNNVTRLVVNLTDVQYIDSSGVASLVEGLQKSREQGLRFGLFGLSDSAREVMKLSRLLKLFEIYDNEDQAIAP